MWKKVLAALLASAMVVSALAGCNKGGDQPKEDTKKEETKKEDKKEDKKDDTQPAADDTVEVVLYHCCYNRNVVDDAQVQKVSDKLNELFAAKGSNARVKIVEIHSSEYADKANLALANNEINILWNSSWWGTISTDDLWRNDAAYDITELVKGTTLWNSMPEGIWQAAMYEGKVLYIPTYKESYEGYDVQLRDSLVEEYGWTYDELDKATWFDKLEPYVAQIAEGGVKYPWMSDAGYYRWLLDYYDSINDSSCFFGIRRTDAKTVVTFESEEFYDLAVLMNQWYEKGYIHEDSVTSNIPSGVGKTTDTGFWMWTDTPGDEIQNASDRDEMKKYIIENFTGRYVHSTTTLGSCYTITKNCTEEQAKAAIEVLGFLFSDPECADTFMVGIEGEDWEWVEVDGEKRIHVIPEGKYNHNSWETVSIMAPDLLDTQPSDQKEDYKRRNEAADVSLAAGFRFDKSAEDIQAIYAACTNLDKEYCDPLQLGGIGSEGIKEYIADYRAMLDEAGFQTLWDEFDKQWNEWYAQNKK